MLPETPSLPAEVLKPLCRPFASKADWILDLHEMTQGKTRYPGKCLRCFYALLQGAGPEKQRYLDPLKRWIEENLVITVQKGDALSETLPVRLREPDLESFCQKAMYQIREAEEATSDAVVTLEIAFKRYVQAA